MNFLTADVVLEVNVRKLEAQLAKARTASIRTATKMQSAFKRMGRVTNRIFSKMARGAKFASLAILGIGIASVKMAMDAQESENLFEVSMGNMATAARRWSEELSDALHLNEFEIRKVIGTFNVMFDSMGLGSEAAYDMARGLTQLSYDMASFYNLKPAEAFQKLQAGITGEAEPLKRLGILINETTVKQFALNNAMWDGVGVMTEQEKIQTRYALILKQTKKAQGDMERTLNSSTNVFRAMWTQVKLLGIAFGDRLRPKITEIAVAIRDHLIENQDAFIDKAGEWVDKIENLVEWTIKWKDELILLGKALVALAIISWAAPLLATFKVVTIGIYGAATASAVWTATLLSTTAAIKFHTAALIADGVASGVAGVEAARFVGMIGKTRLAMMGLTKTFLASKAALLLVSKAALALGAIWGVWQIGKLAKGIWDYDSALRSATEHQEKMLNLTKRLTEEQPEATIGGWTYQEMQNMLPLMEALRKEAVELNAAFILKIPEVIRFDDPGFIENFNKQAAAQEKASTTMMEMMMQARGLNEELRRTRLIAEYTSAATIAFGDNIDGATASVERFKDTLTTEDEMRKSMEAAAERAIALRDMYSDMGRFAEGYYEFANQQLLDQKELYEQMMIDQNLIDIWYFEQRKNLLEETATGWDAVGVSIDKWMEKQKEWGKNLGGILTTAFETMSQGLATALIESEMFTEKFRMDWKALGRAVIQEILAMIIQMQLMYVWQLLTGTVGTGFGGGGSTQGLLGFGGSLFGKAPTELATGGVVTQTGWAKVDKDEVFSGVNNEMGFGGVTINNYASDVVEIDVMDEGRVVEISRRTSIQAAASDGTYRQAHRIGGR